MELSIWQLLYLYLIGLVLSLLEIQIEGPSGWAKNLPTKRVKNWLYGKFGKEITFYHLYLQIFLLLFLHLPLVLAGQVTLKLEVLIISQYFFFLIYWDYLWFVLNPHFRLKDFSKESAPWHGAWFMGLPLDYWLGVLVAVFLPVIFFGWALLFVQLTYLLVYTLLVLLTVGYYYLFYKEKL